MRRINRLADRLLDKVVPSITAEAACKYLRTDTYFVGDSSCSSGIRIQTVIRYDNCPPKTTSHCFG